MNRSSAVLLASGAAVFTACAHTPPLTMQYYHSRSELSLKVTRTVACDGSDHLIVANVASPTIRYSADRGVEPARIFLAGLRRTGTDSDLKFEFHEDGRLKAVNSSYTGQGEVILKAASSFFGAILEIDGDSSAAPDLCAQIKSWNGGKPVTLTNEGELDPALPVDRPKRLSPDAAAVHYDAVLRDEIGGVFARVTNVRPPTVPVVYEPKRSDVLLTLRQPALVEVSVTAGRGEEVWSGVIPAGQRGEVYSLPIPGAALFGKRTFALGLSESGALTSVQYAQGTSVAQAFGAAGAVADLLDGKTAAQRAADLKAEADLIAAQQRLVTCRANPASCK